MYDASFKTSQLRDKLMAEGLQRSDLNTDPVKQFEKWYGETCSTDLPESSAMILATVDSDGQPWQRTVLLKTFDESGFVFYTNYSSRKAEHIKHNNKVSLLFPWHPMGRQVKVTGTAEKISEVYAKVVYVESATGQTYRSKIRLKFTSIPQETKAFITETLGKAEY